MFLLTGLQSEEGLLSPTLYLKNCCFWLICGVGRAYALLQTIFHNCCFWVICEVGGAYGFLHYLIFPPVIPATCAAALSPVYTCTKTSHLSITCHLESHFLNITCGCSNTCPGDCPHTPSAQTPAPLQPSPLWSIGCAPSLELPVGILLCLPG